MTNHKLMAVLAAAALAVTPGLVACGGEQPADTKVEQKQATDAAKKDTDTTSSKTDTQTVETMVDDIKVAETGAKGTTDDGAYDVIYRETRDLESGKISGTLIMRDVQTGASIIWKGDIEEVGTKYTLTDIDNGSVITYEIPEIDPSTGNVEEFKMKIDERGDATLHFVNDVKELDADIDNVLLQDTKVVNELKEEAGDAAKAGAAVVEGLAEGTNAATDGLSVTAK